MQRNADIGLFTKPSRIISLVNQKAALTKPPFSSTFRNINYMSAEIFSASLDFGENCYFRTAFQDIKSSGEMSSFNKSPRQVFITVLCIAFSFSLAIAGLMRKLAFY